MNSKSITLRGCRENNLKNINLTIEKGKITIFTGVSGSGKSSIVFNTIGKEAQRQLNETFSAFIQKFLPKHDVVKADYIDNLSTPIIIDQKRIVGNSRSTLGTISDINPLIRVLFSRIGTPYIGSASSFSFNNPRGMCPECEGIGRKLTVDINTIFDKTKSINEGAILLPNHNVGSWMWRPFADSNFFDNDKKISEFTDEELDKFLYGEPEKIKTEVGNLTYEGLVVKFKRLYLKKEGEISDSTKKKIDKYMIESECSHCKGKRFNEEILSCLINDKNISDILSMQIDEVIEFIDKIDDEKVLPVVTNLREKLQNIVDIGIGYLSLDRETSSLSGGESQRVKIVKYLNSSLTDLMYIFDEPSIGLHPSDVYKLNNLLIKLRDKGNTILVVEHDPDVIKIADYIVDVGPKAGKDGGNIVFEGSYENLLKSNTLTGNSLKNKISIKKEVRNNNGYLSLTNCNKNNLKNVSVKIPKEVLTVVTGVAGSGKSTLIKHELLKQYKDAVLIDQSPVSTNSRSNLATYTGIMDNIRKIFAKENDVSISLFSYNSEGACESCNGTGIIETDLVFMDNVKNICEVCEGKRFKKEVLDYKFNSKNIIDVLEMTVTEAIEFFKSKQVKSKLISIEEMGVGYLTLGQTLDTLSGGECQRLKLANEIHKDSAIYIMDEPTTGLHMSDIQHFIDIVNKIVDNKNTVIIIEHNTDIMKNADWIIDMGPAGGVKGGTVVFEGTPLQLAKYNKSLTSSYIN